MIDFAARFEDRDLARASTSIACWIKRIEFMFLISQRVPRWRKSCVSMILFVSDLAADRHVDIRAHVAVLHVAIAGAQVAQDLAQLDDIGRGFFGAANIGARDDLHQRHAGAVEIDERHVRVHVVDRFAGVLFKVNALDPYERAHTSAHIHQHFAFADNRVV